MADRDKVVRIIVNADDYGLTPGINRSIEELGTSGAISSATLMAAGPAFQNAADTAPTGIGVGCHVVLIDGAPVADPALVPSLLAKGGQFRTSLLRFATDLQSRRICERQIELEATAQIRQLQGAGIRVTHVDTHKHTHLFPRVARPLMRAANACGVRAIRNPFEEAWSARLTRGALLRKIEVAALRGFHDRFFLLCRAAGLHTTDGIIGVSATGNLDAATLHSLLQAAPAGTWELVCHPGYDDADLAAIRTRLRRTREIERLALAKQIPDAVSAGRIRLINFADLD